MTLPFVSGVNCFYCERQYAIEDPGGHTWTFSQTIADVAPEEWGGALNSNDSATL